MKSAFLLFNYSPFGGLERNFKGIAETCLSRGHEVHVFTMTWKDERPEGIHVALVPCSGHTNHGRCASYVKNLKQILNRSEYDLLVGFNRMPELDLYYAADVCYVSDIRQRRGPLYRLSPRYRTYAAFERSVFAPESPTEILYLTESQKQDYMGVYGTPEDRFHYLPPGIDRKRLGSCPNPDVRRQIRQELGLKEGDKLALMVGSDFIRKGVDRSIKALGTLPEDLRNRTRLFVVGRGKERPLKRLSAGLGVSQNVQFLGGREDVPRFLAAADVLLHPARSENTGNAILEAIVAGVPVLTTRACGYSTHVEQADGGKVVDSFPFRQDQMNDALYSMLTSPGRAQWQKNALWYADNTDLYSRPQRAATIMEDLVRRRQAASSSL